LEKGSLPTIVGSGLAGDTMKKRVTIPILFVLACLFAGIYGALHNQISYSVAPEYFTQFKFIKFQIPVCSKSQSIVKPRDPNNHPSTLVAMVRLRGCSRFPVSNLGGEQAMKRIALVPVMVVLGLAAGSFADPPALTSGKETIGLRDLTRYERITSRPFEMHDTTATLCVPPPEIAENPHEPSLPKKAFCHVYVNALAKETILSGKGTYPEGSIVIKSKLGKPDDRNPVLLTVMQKMPSGYDEEHGNWRYSVVDGTEFRLIAAGRIESCIACHDQYAETDYITRTYLADARDAK
jgi:hypothetical protein